MSYFSMSYFLLSIFNSKVGNPSDLFTQILNFFFNKNNNPFAVVIAVVLVAIIVYRVIYELIQLRRDKMTNKPLKITIEKDGKSITIEAPNQEKAQELLRQFEELHPKISNDDMPNNTLEVTETIKKTPKG